jgi:hypothetical protein
MKTFNFKVCFGEGRYADGLYSVQAESEDVAYDVALKEICDKLYAALPDLDIEVQVDLESISKFCVCALGYDAQECITDYEVTLGEFDTYEEAYEAFVHCQCNPLTVITGFPPEKVSQILLQLERCIEDDDEIHCEEICNEWWIDDTRNIFNIKVEIGENTLYFKSPNEFIEIWSHFDEGVEYQVSVNGRVICSGAVDPNDIEIFEEFFKIQLKKED